MAIVFDAQSDNLCFHRSPKKDRPNLSRTVFLSSGLVSATSGKSFSHSYGLQASITAREFAKTVVAHKLLHKLGEVQKVPDVKCFNPIKRDLNDWNRLNG